MQELEKIVGFVSRTNWLLLMVTSLLATAVFSVSVSLGVFLGGLIVAINFHFLKNTIIKNLSAEAVSIKGRGVVSSVLVNYYIRFGVTAGIIYLLISQHVVHPLGLLAGLSVVVASLFAATVMVLKRLLFKEAV